MTPRARKRAEDSNISLILLDHAPGSDLSDCSDRLPRVGPETRAPREREPGSTEKRSQEFYSGQSKRESGRGTRLRPASASSARWREALATAGLPICRVCRTKNSSVAIHCSRCGEVLPSPDPDVHPDDRATARMARERAGLLTNQIEGVRPWSVFGLLIGMAVLVFVATILR